MGESGVFVCESVVLVSCHMVVSCCECCRVVCLCCAVCVCPIVVLSFPHDVNESIRRSEAAAAAPLDALPPLASPLTPR